MKPTVAMCFVVVIAQGLVPRVAYYRDLNLEKHYSLTDIIYPLSNSTDCL